MKIEIKDGNGKMITVEVSEEVYAVLQEESKEQEHQRYERRKHIDDRELSDYIVHQNLLLFILLRMKPIQVIWYRENQLKLEINK